MKEGQLDGLLQKPQQGSLFLLRSTQGLHLVATKRAKLKHLPATAAKPMHAGITHDFAAMSALVGHKGLGMAWTNQAAVLQDDRRRGPFDVEFGNRDGHVGA